MLYLIMRIAEITSEAIFHLNGVISTDEDCDSKAKTVSCVVGGKALGAPRNTIIGI